MTTELQTPVTVAMVDALGVQDASAVVQSLCTSTRWQAAMLAARPWASRAGVHAAADAAFDRLDTAAWLDAFAGHPRIGDRKELARRFAGSGAHSLTEQAGLDEADAAALDELAEKNDAYWNRFGHVFLIRAAGRGPDDILAALKARLSNSPEQELRIAADEQRQITHLRIDATFQPDTEPQ